MREKRKRMGEKEGSKERGKSKCKSIDMAQMWKGRVEKRHRSFFLNVGEFDRGRKREKKGL